MFSRARRPRSPTGYVDSRSRNCGNGSPPCERAPEPGENPLRLCLEHLAEHNARCGIPEPWQCPACSSGPMVLVGGRFLLVAGAMCFACGIANGGTVASAQHRHEARQKMTRRLAVLFTSGDRGPEWAALLARCPPDIWTRIALATFKTRPSPTFDATT